MKNNIKKIRKKAKISQRKLSKILGVDASQVSRLENGDTKLHSEWIRKLTDILNCTADELLGEEIVEDKIIDMSHPLSPQTIMEIYRQIDLLLPDETTDKKIDAVFVIYDELKGPLGIDPGYVRAFFKFKDLSEFL